MLLRKLPDELFLGRRTYAHDLFGAQEVEGYLDHLDVAIERQLDELGARRHLRRVRARAPARSPARARLLDGRRRGRAAAARRAHRRSRVSRRRRGLRAPGTHGRRATTTRPSNATRSRASKRVVAARLAVNPAKTPRRLPRRDRAPVGRRRRRRPRPRRHRRRRAAPRRDDDQPVRGAGVDAVPRAARPRRARPGRGRRARELDRGFLDRCALEAVRIGQRSIMLRSVLKPCELDDGADDLSRRTGRAARDDAPAHEHDRAPGSRPASIPIAGPVADCATTTRSTRRSSVTTFGHGSHRCPAQRFSLSAIGRAVERLFATFDLQPEFDAVRAVPSQIGGVARSADPCPVAYVRRPAITLRPAQDDSETGVAMADEIEFETPWRRDLGELGSRARRLGGREDRRRRDVDRRRVAGQRHVERDRALHGATARAATTIAVRGAARAAARAVSRVPAVRPRAAAPLHGPRARAHRRARRRKWSGTRPIRSGSALPSS